MGYQEHHEAINKWPGVAIATSGVLRRCSTPFDDLPWRERSHQPVGLGRTHGHQHLDRLWLSTPVGRLLQVRASNVTGACNSPRLGRRHRWPVERTVRRRPVGWHRPMTCVPHYDPRIWIRCVVSHKMYAFVGPRARRAAMCVCSGPAHRGVDGARVTGVDRWADLPDGRMRQPERPRRDCARRRRRPLTAAGLDCIAAHEAELTRSRPRLSAFRGLALTARRPLTRDRVGGGPFTSTVRHGFVAPVLGSEQVRVRTALLPHPYVHTAADEPRRGRPWSRRPTATIRVPGLVRISFVSTRRGRV